MGGSEELESFEEDLRDTNEYEADAVNNISMSSELHAGTQLQTATEWLEDDMARPELPIKSMTKRSKEPVAAEVVTTSGFF